MVHIDRAIAAAVTSSCFVLLACGSNGSSHQTAAGGGGGGIAAVAGESSGGTSSAGASAAGAAGTTTAQGGDGSGASSGALTVTVAPTSAQAVPSGNVQFTATVSGSPDQAVSWTIQETQGAGTISATGVYTAPSSIGTFHVIASSHADPAKSASASVTVSMASGTPPTLKPGAWTDITPAGLNLVCCAGTVPNGTYGTTGLAIDPSNPNTLYLSVDSRGMYKSTDRGTSWVRLGDPSKMGSTQTGFLDGPFGARVDPRDPQRLIATQGVRGMTQGFWVSTDGGVNWTMPEGFQTAAKSVLGSGPWSDVTTLAVDPTDFDHLLLGSHSPWTGKSSGGVYESKDGGKSWTIHPPQASWTPGSLGINFLYEPKQGLGDANTWLVSDQSAGYWRTTDAGQTWTQVSKSVGIHGGTQGIYYTSQGVLYAGASPYPLWSKDNGKTWTALADSGLPYSYYAVIQGDGTNLYAHLDGDATATPTPFYTSKESDGLKWVPMNGGAQTFALGPFTMKYDTANRILYSSLSGNGLWALLSPAP